MTPDVPTEWRVMFGDRLQFRAYFQDQAAAEKYAATHNGRIVPLTEFHALAQHQLTLASPLTEAAGAGAPINPGAGIAPSTGADHG